MQDGDPAPSGLFISTSRHPQSPTRPSSHHFPRLVSLASDWPPLELEELLLLPPSRETLQLGWLEPPACACWAQRGVGVRTYSEKGPKERAWKVVWERAVACMLAFGDV